jgi:transposase
VTGARKSVKIFGAVEVFRAAFLYKQDTVFNAGTYLSFLKMIKSRYRHRGAILVQDNASYHKNAEVWAWFSSNRDWLEVHQLPPYSPEFNATERIWQHTRKNGTHNRYFITVAELLSTLERVFVEIQEQPSLIRGYLLPFCA